MKIVFAGTPEFAQTALLQLLQSNFDIALVLTQPDRPAGRGMHLQASPVKQTALAHGISVIQPRGLRLDGKYADDAKTVQQILQDIQPDVMVVAAYGLLLPQWTLDLPHKGCINIHASLLPRWRGAAPIHRAIEAGDTHTGITIMQMDAGLDTGDILQTTSIPIADSDTTATLHDKLADLGGKMIVHSLQLLQQEKLQHYPQPTQNICYADKVQKTEALIDWTQSALVLARRIRAFNPFPVAMAYAPSTNAKGLLQWEPIKIWEASISKLTRPISAQAGQLIQLGPTVTDGIHVACGHNAEDGVLCLKTLQRAGGKPLAASDWLRGFNLVIGSILGTENNK